MKATITIEMDNAAFDGGHATELGRILRKLAKRLDDQHSDYVPIMEQTW